MFKEYIDAAIDLEKQANHMRRLAAQVKDSCHHNWEEIKYDPQRTPGYHFNGDPVGTMGVDRQLPFDVPPSTIDMWTRTCKTYGFVQSTSSKKMVGAPLQKEVPDFGD